MNRLHHLACLGWQYGFRRREIVPCPPYQYTIEPTNHCNFRCDFCPQSDPHHQVFRPLGYLTLANLRLFLSRVRDVSPGNRNINFTLDGEPFLNPDFPAMIRMAVEAGHFPIFASNGALMDGDRAAQLMAAGPFRASIDFASDEKIFESIRGRPGDFERVRRNITALMEAARTNPGIHLDIHDISSYAGANPAESLRRMRALFPQHLPRNVHFASRRFHNFCGHLKTTIEKNHYHLCPYPWVQMAVTWSGDCVPCCRDTAGRTVLGNIFTDSVMTVWNGEAYRQLRRHLLDRRPDLIEACRDCDVPYRTDAVWRRPGYLLRSLLKR